MPHTRHSLMLITSDNVVIDRLERLIKSNGYGLTLATTVPQALIDVRRSLPALILADRQLIEQGRLRRDQLPASIPVIAVHRFDQACEREECLSDLDAGFDLTFCATRSREVIAHIRAMLRRHESHTNPAPQLRIEGLSMDIPRHEVRVRDQLVELTPKEFQILQQFLTTPGTVLARQDLLNRVWGEDYALEEHALDVHIHSLRQKIERDASKPSFIVTIRGIGYKLQYA